MNDNLISAVFDSHSEAEAAARDLRQAGVRDSALSVIARRQEESGDYGDADTHEAKEKGEGALKGAIGGAGVGALLGIAALAIPGVGPLAAAGAIASTAIPEAAAIGKLIEKRSPATIDHWASSGPASAPWCPWLACGHHTGAPLASPPDRYRTTSYS